MNKNKAIILCAALFASYPSVNEFHVTSDGQAFAEKQNAEAHASFLNKKEPVVVSVSRDDKAESTEETEGEKAVTAAKGLVKKLTDKLTKAADKNKAAVQMELDAAVKAMAEAEEALLA